MKKEELQDAKMRLQQRISELEAQQAAGEARRDALALDAMTGDTDAKREVAELGKVAGSIASELRMARAAIGDADRRIATIEAEERCAAERANAKEALALLESFGKRGAALDSAFARVVAEYSALVEEVKKLDALGLAPPTYSLVKVNMRRAAQAKLMFTDLQDEFLAPNERRDFVSVISGWANGVRARATATLNQSPAQAA